YALRCPICGDGYEREIKPRGRDPGFVEEFSAQIRLVAFDTLVNHLLGEHEDLDLPSDEEAAPEPSAPRGAPRRRPGWPRPGRRNSRTGARRKRWPRSATATCPRISTTSSRNTSGPAMRTVSSPSG